MMRFLIWMCLVSLPVLCQLTPSPLSAQVIPGPQASPGPQIIPASQAIQSPGALPPVTAR